jgi:endonuclease/exonuclease/phosphatase family metal-dependent hydrolase
MLRVIGGDFNGTPETTAIQHMREEFDSAYAKIHGNEPVKTAPTPLKRSLSSLVRTLFRFRKLIRLRDFSLRWSGTLDYLFVDQRLQVLDCQVVFDRPDENNPGIYPSDHYGIFARIGLPEKPQRGESKFLRRAIAMGIYLI